MRTGAGLTGLPDIPAAGIALDDADAVADESALLHLLNAAGEAGRAGPARRPRAAGPLGHCICPISPAGCVP